MKVYNKILSEKTLVDCFSYLRETIAQEKPHWKNSYIWAESIVRRSNPVNILKIIDKKLINKITKDLKEIPEFKNVKIKNTAFNLYFWDRGSYIPFHSDKGNKFSATIYLNDVWDENDGGIFLYKQNNEIKGILPEYNKIIVNNKFLEHSVSMIVPTAEHPRVTMQIFENDKR